MTSIKHRTTVSHGAVAAIAAVLSAAGTLSAIKFVETSVAQPAPAAPGQLLTQPLSDLPGREVRMSILDRDPGSAALVTGTPVTIPSGTCWRVPTNLRSTASRVVSSRRGTPFMSRPPPFTPPLVTRAPTPARRFLFSWWPIKRTRALFRNSAKARNANRRDSPAPQSGAPGG
jgi:hypothetical protein